MFMLCLAHMRALAWGTELPPDAVYSCCIGCSILMQMWGTYHGVQSCCHILVALAALGCSTFTVCLVDVGDSAWGTELPPDAVQDMKEAKGTIYETADQPWW